VRESTASVASHNVVVDTIGEKFTENIEIDKIILAAGLSLMIDPDN
jgi:hypothetical protein